MKKPYSKEKKNKIGHMALVLTVLSGAIYYGITRLPRATPIGINEIDVNPGTVTLYLPERIATDVGTEITLNLTMDTGGSKVTAAQVVLSYDPSAISTPTVVNGNILPVTLAKPSSTQGITTFAYAISPESGGYNGTGILATLSFKSIKPDSRIDFASNTMVAALNSEVNVLKATAGTIIGKPTAQNNATPLPTTATTSIKTNTSSQPNTNTAIPLANQGAITDTDERIYDATLDLEYTQNDREFEETTSEDELVDNSSAFTKFINWVRLILGTSNDEN